MVSRFAWALVVCVAATTVFAPIKAEEGTAASKCKEEKEAEVTGTELHQETAGGMKRGSQGYDGSKLYYLGRRGYSDRYYLAYHGRDYFPNRRLNQEHDHEEHDHDHEDHDHDHEGHDHDEDHDHDHEEHDHDEDHDHDHEEHDHDEDHDHEEHDHDDHEDERPTPEPEPEPEHAD